MPEPLPLSSERLVRHGLFLIDDGQSMFLWVGQDAVPQLIMDVFDLPSFEALRNGKVYFLSSIGLNTLLTKFKDDSTVT